MSSKVKNRYGSIQCNTTSFDILLYFPVKLKKRNGLCPSEYLI